MNSVNDGKINGSDGKKEIGKGILPYLTKD